MLRTFGLIGYPLGHSFSAGYFTEKFKKEKITDAQYLNFPLEKIEDFRKIFEKGYFIKGLNVTIPYKQAIIPFLSNLSPQAEIIGAVNTIKVLNDHTLVGYNTDEYGFRISLLAQLKPYHKKALILGSGGASKAVEFVLNDLNIEYIIVTRYPSASNHVSYNQLDKSIIDSHLLIVNTTPLGMYPNIESYPPLPYQYISSKHFLYDLVYNPLKTKFLLLGEQQGAIIVNGLQMLHLQAEKAWEIWNT